MCSIKPVKIAYKVVEPTIKSNKPDIIILHGVTASKEHFDDVADDLANQTNRKLYILDARNHGDSEWSDEFSFEAMTADVLNFMNEHHINSAVLLGHSMGGRLAMILALTHPEKVEKLIVEDSTPKNVSTGTLEGYQNLLKLFEDSVDIVPSGSDIDTAIATIFEYVLVNKSPDILQNYKVDPNKTMKYPLVKKGDKYAWKTNFPILRKEIKNMALTKDLEGLFVKPSLFLYGTLSEFNVVNDKDFILNLFPKAKLHGIESSHNVHHESPEDFVQQIVQFLQ